MHPTGRTRLPTTDGSQSSHLRQQGLPTSGGTPIVHARAGGHGLLLSSTGGLAGGARHSSPGADQHGRVAVPCMGSRKRRASLRFPLQDGTGRCYSDGTPRRESMPSGNHLSNPPASAHPHTHTHRARVRADDPTRPLSLCGEGRKGDSGPARFVPALVAPSNALFHVTLETGPPTPTPQPYGMRVICVHL